MKLAILLKKIPMLATTLMGQWWDEALMLTGSYAVAFFTPTWKFLAGVCFLIVADMLMAIAATKKSGQEVKSRKMMRTVWKLIVYALLIMVAHVVKLMFKFPDTWPIVEGVTGLVCTIELKSMDENFKLITGKSVFSQLINLVNKKTENENKP